MGSEHRQGGHPGDHPPAEPPCPIAGPGSHSHFTRRQETQKGPLQALGPGEDVGGLCPDLLADFHEGGKDHSFFFFFSFFLFAIWDLSSPTRD